jgi:drug/metabolite transporter (DMT)-like permease
MADLAEARPDQPDGGRPTRFAALSGARRGAVLFAAAGLGFTASDAMVKALVDGVSVIDVLWGRTLVYVLAVVLISGRGHPRRLLATNRKRLQVVRGLTLFGATGSFFLALSLLPLAEASTLSATSPLMVVALAGPILGERVHRTAIIGAVVGFAGVVTLVGLDPAHLNAAALVALLNAASFALFSLLTRRLRDESADATVFYSGFVSFVAATVVLVIVPAGPVPDRPHIAGIVVIGLIGLFAHRLLVSASRFARASDLAPLGYLTIVWSFIIGATVFSEPVRPHAIAGAIAISIGGFIALRSSSGGEPDVLVSADFGDPVDLTTEDR